MSSSGGQAGSKDTSEVANKHDKEHPVKEEKDGDDDDEAIVYMKGMKGMTWLVFCGCSGWLFIGLDK